jgi:hypothetical protein
MLEAMLWACVLALFGSIASNSALWYKIGKLEKAVYNGNITSKKNKEWKRNGIGNNQRPRND